MIPKPDDLDAEQVARVHAMLDAFVEANQRHASLALHESSEWPHLAYAVADWAHQKRLRIETHIANGNGRTYEVWGINTGVSTVASISVWPLKIGLLDGRDELARKIQAIRKEADERVKELLELEQAKAAQP